MDLSQILGASGLSQEINADAASMEIGPITEPRHNPPQRNGKELFPLGLLSENLRTLRRLELWYNIHSAGEDTDIMAKQRIVRGIFDYFFSREYAKNKIAGYEIAVFSGWRVIAYPII